MAWSLLVERIYWRIGRTCRSSYVMLGLVMIRSGVSVYGYLFGYLGSFGIVNV